MKMQSVKSLFVVGVLIVFFSACNQEEEYSINTKKLSVITKDSVALSVTPANSGWVFASANPTIASVSASGMVTGKHVGKTTISVTNTINGMSEQVDVTVTAKNTLFCEPYPYFFVSEKTVMDYEKRTLAGSGRLTDDVSYLLYEPENLYYEGVVYLFSDSLNYFESEVVMFNWHETKMNAHLNDRYITTQEYTQDPLYKPLFDAFMVNPDTTTQVCIYNGFQERCVLIYRPSNCLENMQVVAWSFYSSYLKKKRN